MGGTTRRVALGVMLTAIALLVVTLATRDRSSPSASLPNPVGSDEPVALPTATPTPNPFAVTTADESVTINRLWSPSPLVARAEGVTTTAGMIVSVQANGRALAPITLDADADGRFSVDIRGLEAGAQELCVAGACQRVLVAEPNQESREVIESRIADAIASAQARFDLDVLAPGWTFVVAGPNSSVGGSANPETKIIMINANSGRSLRDYEITVIHEIGHAVDATWMDDTKRDQFRSARQLDPSLPWGARDPVVIGGDRWRDASEDFAEMFVALTLGADYPIETVTIGRQPTADELVSFCQLIAAESLDCS